MEATFVVVGGGIAGVTCAETLALLKPEETVILITESPVIKAVVNLLTVSKMLSTFDVTEQTASSLSDRHPNITVIQDSLVQVLSKSHIASTKQGQTISYKYLCLCTGGKPRIIAQGQNSPYVLGLRDSDSVDTLMARVGAAHKVAIVGNGGIATELVYKMQQLAIDWVVKDRHTTATFVDPGAAQFFNSSLTTHPRTQPYSTRMRYRQDGAQGSGAALGPDWYSCLDIVGSAGSPKAVQVHYGCEVADITYPPGAEHPVLLHLTDGRQVACDLVISATGVDPEPTVVTDQELRLSADRAMLVDEYMQTSLTDVFAAGDACWPGWPLAKHWFPMRLWTQARQTGCYAARCMAARLAGDLIHQDFCFELFAHCTSLFGYKVALLGLYNGQTLGTDYECLVRTTPGIEFIKFVLQDNRLQGAILIGDTDLAETCENLILNQLDLSPYGDDLLNPDIDIEDYFD